MSSQGASSEHLTTHIKGKPLTTGGSAIWMVVVYGRLDSIQ